MKTFEILIGIPGSGKSTYAKSQIHPNPFHANVARVNKDDIRAQYPKMKEKEVVKEEEQRIMGYVNQGIERIIIDNTHLNTSHHARLSALAKQCGYAVEFKWFDDSLDADLCHKRNILAGRTPVPWQVIETMHAQYVSQWLERTSQEVKNMSDIDTHVIVVDLDGTIAHNDGHRGWYDWKAVGGDKPHKDILVLINALVAAGTVDEVVFLSGRDSICRAETFDWIEREAEPYLKMISSAQPVPWHLYMRKEGDMRKDWIVKHELFMEHLNGQKFVKYWLDDRHQVVRHIRALGIRVLQVEAGLK